MNNNDIWVLCGLLVGQWIWLWAIFSKVSEIADMLADMTSEE